MDGFGWLCQVSLRLSLTFRLVANLDLAQPFIGHLLDSIIKPRLSFGEVSILYHVPA